MPKMIFPALAAGSIAAMLAAAGRNIAPQVIENRGQAMPKGAQRAVQTSRPERHRMKKEAALELMDMSRKTLVVAHLHPRWLRRCVEELMGMGAVLTAQDVEDLRNHKPISPKWADDGA